MVTSGDVTFYYSLEPEVDLQLIDTVSFGSIEPSEYIEINFNWETDMDMDPRIYILTLILTDIQPYDINPENDSAYKEIPLPIELAYFTASGFPDRVEIKWMTITETDNLGFNLYRLKAEKITPFISYSPVKLNETLIPGQGTSSQPEQYQFTDHVDYGSKNIYLLECISTEGIATEEYRTRLKWMF